MYVHRFGEACCIFLDELAQAHQFVGELATQVVSIDISAFPHEYERMIIYSQMSAPSFLQQLPSPQ